MGNSNSKQTKKSSALVVNSDALLHVRFLWAKSHSLYRRMSHNIAREICLYVGRLPELLYYYDHVMYRVNPVKQTKELFFVIGSGFTDSIVGVQRAVFIGRDEVFLLLRDVNHPGEDLACYAMFKEEALCSVSDNRHDKFACALLYDPIRICVYVFGGHGVGDSRSSGSLNKDDSPVVEKFKPSNCSTERLPDMLEPRSAHAVCWHHLCVYICGGTHPSIERFHPQTLTYTKMYELPEMVSDVIAFSYQGSLYMLSDRTIWKENARNFQKIIIDSMEEPGKWRSAPYSVAVIGDCCCFIYERQCKTLNLRTLTETSFFTFPTHHLKPLRLAS